MSTNLFIFFVFVFSVLTFFSFFMDGRTGVATASLTADLTVTATSMTVDSTTGFDDGEDIVRIGGEVICYTGITATTFTGLTRGQDCQSRKDNEAVSHNSGTRVYSDAPGTINQLVGFDIGSAFSDGGVIGILKGVVSSAAHLPQFLGAVMDMVMWDYSYLTGPGVYVKYFLFWPLSAGMVLSFVRMAMGR